MGSIAHTTPIHLCNYIPSCSKLFPFRSRTLTFSMILGNISKQNQPVVVIIGAKSRNHYDFNIFALLYFLFLCHAVKLTSWIVNLWEFEISLGESPCYFGSNKGPYTNHIMSCALTFQFLTITPRSTLVSMPRK